MGDQGATDDATSFGLGGVILGRGHSLHLDGYMWPEDWACRAPSLLLDGSERFLATRTTCDKDGEPLRGDEFDLDEAVVLSTQYTYRDGRLVERVTVWRSAFECSTRRQSAAGS